MNFELEPEAEAIFLRHLDEQPFELKDAVSDGVLPRRSKKPPAKRSRLPEVDNTIDLHGLRLIDALSCVEERIQSWLRAKSDQLMLRIITGKGLHSKGPGRGVLAREIHAKISSKYRTYIVAMDTAPGEVALAGVPIRGHFDVIFRKK